MSNKEIIDALSKATLSADECTKAFNVLLDQTTVLGGKIWTDNDIMEICECMKKGGRNIIVPDDIDGFIEDVRECIPSYKLNQCFDKEYWAIEDAISDVLDHREDWL